jgi:mevalonate kinase
MRFNAKILLFGEYSVLHKSDALLMPFSLFSGEFSFIDKSERSDLSKIKSNEVLKDFYRHFNVKQSETNIFKHIDWSKFFRDIEAGLYFNSNIPIGYGVGSSGALVAAFYSRYGVAISFDKYQIKEILAFFESYFHGSSSGLDPLVSFINKSIYAQHSVLDEVNINISGFNPFLIDTGTVRSTENLVSIFKDKCKNGEYLSLVQNELTQVSNQSIKYLINNEGKGFFENLKQLSILQFEMFSEMISPKYSDLWQAGIKSEEYFLKLCGAGGGGYVLGFARESKYLDQLKKTIKSNLIEI